jgi:transposase
LQRKRRLWSKAGREALEKLNLLPFAARRRAELLDTLDGLEKQIRELDQAVAAEAQNRPEAVCLMTHPGVGPNTALGMVLTLGPVERFRTAKQVSSYLGLIPREHSSGGRQRLGHISKQGNALMRFLLVEAGQTAARIDEGLRRQYRRWSLRIGRIRAKVAVARKLATKLYWMLRTGKRYAQQ